MPELIVLTCAYGKQCTRVIPLLRKHTAFALRLVVHSQTSADKLRARYPDADVEVLQADLDNTEHCRNIVEGATTIYYVSPTFQPQELQYATDMINAAAQESKRPGSPFSHFILSSVIHPEISKMLNHDRKRLIEEYLCESSLNYTILQPSHLMDNTLPRIMAQRTADRPIFVANHNPEVAFSFSCLHDYAEVSAKVIQERSKHYFATYQLVSTFPIKYTEYIRLIGTALGVDFEIQRMPYGEAVELYCKRVFGTRDGEVTEPRLRDGPERMLLYYNGRGLLGNPAVTEWLLGRPAKSPADLAKMLLEEEKEEKSALRS